MTEPEHKDGRDGFTFLYGQWDVSNRKLQHPLDPVSTEWVEFPAWVETEPLLNGLGNIDRYSAPDFPNLPGFEAIALRLFDVGGGVWRIWWASTISGGLDTPVVGRFTDGHGVFECDDILEGRSVRVRYEWLDSASPSPRWKQSFSLDGGRSWQVNWIMHWRRRDTPR
jgi:hypothetical protein